MRNLFALVLLGAAASASFADYEFQEDVRQLKKKDKEEELDDYDEEDDEEFAEDEIIEVRIDEAGDFLKYAAKHNKFYTTAEEFVLREDCYKKNHAKVKELRALNPSV